MSPQGKKKETPRKEKQQGKQEGLQLKRYFLLNQIQKFLLGFRCHCLLAAPLHFLSFFFGPSGHDGHFISLQKHIEPGHLSVRQEISAIIWLPLPESGHKWGTAETSGLRTSDIGPRTTAQSKLYKLGKKRT